MRSKTTHRRRPQTTHKILRDLCKGEIDKKEEITNYSQKETTNYPQY
jgi:hypothetical protein